MAERDPALDMMLRQLAQTTDAAEDERWSKRVAARCDVVRPDAGVPGSKELFEGVFPDGFEDDEPLDEVAELPDEARDGAASAADEGDGAARGWEGSISTPGAEAAPLDPMVGLARLARSGPHPTLRPPVSAPIGEGAAGGDDSGLIDLRAMTAPAEEAPAVVARAADPRAVTNPQAPSAKLRAAGALAPQAVERPSIPPSTTQPQAASVAAPSAAGSRERRGGVVLYVVFGGLAAAAAAVFFFVQPKRDGASVASGSQPAATMAASESAMTGSTAPKPAATLGSPIMVATADSASAAADPADTVAIAPAGTAMPLGGSKSAPAPTVAGTGNTSTPAPKSTGTTASKPAMTAPTPTSDPVTKPSGGSLDDVLGLGKPPPATTSTAATPDLPDKPDNGDVRSAINSRVGSASACVKGLDAPSKVTVSFSPAGTVAAVMVTSGPAKGTGAEACIKSAFTSAKVPRSKMGATGYASLLP